MFIVKILVFYSIFNHINAVLGLSIKYFFSKTFKKKILLTANVCVVVVLLVLQIVDSIVT